MKKYLILLSLPFLIAGCATSEVDETAKKKAELQKLKATQQQTAFKISQLEKQLATLDPSFKPESTEIEIKKVLVTLDTIGTSDFEHFIEFQATASANQNIGVSPEMSGVIKEIYVKEGDYINKGQTIAKLDDIVMQNQIIELQSALAVAKTVYDKRARLWQQNIGSEIEYIRAKADVSNIENQITTIRSQTGKSMVYAPFSGSVEEVLVRNGEMASPGRGIVRLVSLNDIKVIADISESYIADVKKGDWVKVSFPTLEEDLNARISAIGQIVNPNNRSFQIEIDIPNKGSRIKPNLSGIVKLKDEEKKDVTMIPTKYIQQGKEGYFVYLAQKEEDQYICKKVTIDLGSSNEGSTIVSTGINTGDFLIAKGFNDVKDGDILEVVTDKEKDI